MKPEAAIRVVREVNHLVESGLTIQEACRQVGVSRESYYRWRSKYAGMTVSEAQKVAELKRENARLKRLVAEQAMDIHVLKEINRGKP
ncbi:MAG: transposase [Thiotrichales bacterium]|nr:transposase [Thiotrichales bacterium]